jgi:hypothetical protein
LIFNKIDDKYFLAIFRLPTPQNAIFAKKTIKILASSITAKNIHNTTF